MGKRVSKKNLRHAAPNWVFSWQPLQESPFQKSWPLLLVATGFAFFLTSLHIRVAPPTPWAALKASVIHVTDDAEGRALTLRAREGGPFPSRFEPSQWDGRSALEEIVTETTRWTPSPYVPSLKNLPDADRIIRLPLAACGLSVLPAPLRRTGGPPSPVKLTRTPVLAPLSGISAAALPREFPPFDGAIDSSMTSENWRFLLNLDAAGNVRDCVFLTAGHEGSPSPLEMWLRRVPFLPAPEKASRWIAVGIDFTNQPTDGPFTR